MLLLFWKPFDTTPPGPALDTLDTTPASGYTRITTDATGKTRITTDVAGYTRITTDAEGES